MNKEYQPITQVYAFDTTELHKKRQDPVYQANEILREKDRYDILVALDKIKMGLTKRILLAFLDIASFDETDNSRADYDPETKTYQFVQMGLSRYPKYMKKRIKKYNKEQS